MMALVSGLWCGVSFKILLQNGGKSVGAIGCGRIA